MHEDPVVIVAAKRTAIGAFGGSLASVPAARLGQYAIEAALADIAVSGDDIDDVILGQVLTAGVGQNPARQAAIYAGIPDAKTAMTINASFNFIDPLRLNSPLAYCGPCCWRCTDISHGPS